MSGLSAAHAAILDRLADLRPQLLGRARYLADLLAGELAEDRLYEADLKDDDGIALGPYLYGLASELADLIEELAQAPTYRGPVQRPYDSQSDHDRAVQTTGEPDAPG